MDTSIKQLVNELTMASEEERIVFPEVVRQLMEAGVERYHVDLVLGSRVYYLPDGASATVETGHGYLAAMEFSAAGVEQAVRAVQRQEIKYLEFCRRIADAGCVGYFVSIAGRRAVYYGRSIDTHVEWFPGAKA